MQSAIYMNPINNQVLSIDLSTQSTSTMQVAPDDRRRYLGGKGLGLLLLSRLVTPQTMPLDPDNPFILMPGILAGSGMPCSSRFSAVSLSPLTNLVASASCGGDFGLALKSLSLDGLILRGATDVPLHIEISENGVAFHDASSLLGLSTTATTNALALGRNDSALVIGPAGENQVRYANIACGTRFLGRAGFGAVLGAKGVKAISIRGTKEKIVPVDPEMLMALRTKLITYLNDNVYTGRLYRQQGTLANLAICQEAGLLPVRNFRGGNADIDGLAGSVWAQAYNAKPHACRTCAILCGHSGTTVDGRRVKIPEYETVGLLGPNLGILEREAVRQLGEQCDELGMDTISMGGTLAYAAEATERGLLDWPLHFGNAEEMSRAIEQTAHRNGLGDELANGSRWLAAKYGGESFAIQVKGMELPAYDPRSAWGQGLAYAVSNRGGCHLTATSFVLESFLGLQNPQGTRGKAEMVFFFNRLYAALNSLQTCLFTAYAYLLQAPLIRLTPNWAKSVALWAAPSLTVKLFDVSPYAQLYTAITGIPLTASEFLEAGERIHTLERYLNTQRGVTRQDDTLPARLTSETPEGSNQGQPVKLDKMLDRYYRLAGYDHQGIPAPQTLTRLDIHVPSPQRDTLQPVD